MSQRRNRPTKTTRTTTTTPKSASRRKRNVSSTRLVQINFVDVVCCSRCVCLISDCLVYTHSAVIKSKSRYFRLSITFCMGRCWLTCSCVCTVKGHKSLRNLCLEFCSLSHCLCCAYCFWLCTQTFVRCARACVSTGRRRGDMVSSAGPTFVAASTPCTECGGKWEITVGKWECAQAQERLVLLTFFTLFFFTFFRAFSGRKSIAVSVIIIAFFSIMPMSLDRRCTDNASRNPKH
jgi:hypothetical protein